jgi:hypothetical protein
VQYIIITNKSDDNIEMENIRTSQYAGGDNNRRLDYPEENMKVSRAENDIEIHRDRIHIIRRINDSPHLIESCKYYLSYKRDMYIPFNMIPCYKHYSISTGGKHIDQQEPTGPQ